MVRDVLRGDVYLVSLNPTRGGETRETRPCPRPRSTRAAGSCRRCSHRDRIEGRHWSSTRIVAPRSDYL